MVAFVITIMITIPSFPEGDSLVNNCLGRNEVYFNFDYFVKGGISRSKKFCSIENQFGKWFCYTSIIAFIILSSNVCEIYFLRKIYSAVRDQTNFAQSLLTKRAFEARKR